ncbi:thiamine pyrophosphate-dependent enzyme, partial [Nakamurella sp. GG22]
PPRPTQPGAAARTIERAEPPAGGGVLQAAHVFTALADRIARNTVIVEESPSSRSLLHALIPAREPLGFLSAAMGGLGFGLPAAVGVKMAQPDRPVIGIIGDGSAMYGIQALWSAAHYGVGVLIVVMANGRYAIMDQLAAAHAENTGTGMGSPPWPGFEEISISRIAGGFGCPATTVRTFDELTAVLDDVLPTLPHRREPLVLEVAVA